MTTVVGIDGATKAAARGYVTVRLVDGRLDATGRHLTLDDALAWSGDASVVAIDLPIGHEGDGVRAADTAARALLGPHADAFQPTPPLELFAIADHGEARRVAESKGWPVPDRLVWLRRQRILDLQQIAARDERLVEVHPEVSFQVLHELLGNEGHLRYAASRWYGLHERLTLLHRVKLRPAKSFGGVGKQGPEDVLAATICAWSAERVAAGEARRFGPGEGPAILA